MSGDLDGPVHLGRGWAQATFKLRPWTKCFEMTASTNGGEEKLVENSRKDDSFAGSGSVHKVCMHPKLAQIFPGWQVALMTEWTVHSALCTSRSLVVGNQFS